VSEVARKARLLRLVTALDRLRELERVAQARADTNRAVALASAAAIDSMDYKGTPTWALFPRSWLGYRSKLDVDITRYAAQSETATKEALRLEKMANRYAEVAGDIEARVQRKRIEEDMLEFAARNQPALGKFAGLGSRTCKQRK
jgi:hypothetical protein